MRDNRVVPLSESWASMAVRTARPVGLVTRWEYSEAKELSSSTPTSIATIAIGSTLTSCLIGDSLGKNDVDLGAWEVG